MIHYLFPTEVLTSGCVCDFHKKNPGKQSAGCTCTSSWTIKVIQPSPEYLKKLSQGFDETWGIPEE